jgi:predicted TIM-barrel fold metal-dependent hydrolase
MTTIIDIHTHAWPDRAAERALADSIDFLSAYGDGKIASLERSMAGAGIDRCGCLGVANTPEQVEKANRFVGGLDPSRFIGFGSVHAELPAAENVASLRRNGLVAAKIHPLFQGYGLDHPGLHETLALMEGHFAVIVHVGAGKDPKTNSGCTPALLAELVERFPRLQIIACHFGGYHLIEEAREQVIGLPVYVDTSWPPTVGGLGADTVRELIAAHGAERVLFGSDWPMTSQADELAAIRAVGLSDDDEHAILGGNAERLFAGLLPAS